MVHVYACGGNGCAMKKIFEYDEYDGSSPDEEVSHVGKLTVCNILNCRERKEETLGELHNLRDDQHRKPFEVMTLTK